MDIFVEQLFVRRMKKKELLLKIALYAACGISAGFISLFLLTFSGGSYFAFSFLAIAGLIYLANYVGGRFNIEFEYCLTNGTFDVDTIVNMRTRSRLASLDCKDLEDFGKYDQARDYNCKAVIYGANEDAPDKYYMIFMHKEKGRCLLVIEPNEKMLKGLKRCLPRQMVFNVFGNNI